MKGMRKFAFPVIAIVLLISLGAWSGCQKSAPAYVPHPGAVSTLDSATYDSLLVAQAALDSATEAYKEGKLPQSSKEPINRAKAAFNVARASWFLYRDAVAKGQPTEELIKKLAADIALTTAAIAEFQRQLGKKL